MKKIIQLTEEMGFELFSFRKYNWRQISLISHLENRVFAKLRKDEFRRTFCSLINTRSRMLKQARYSSSVSTIFVLNSILEILRGNLNNSREKIDKKL